MIHHNILLIFVMAEINASNHRWSLHSNLIIFPWILIRHLSSLWVHMLRIINTILYPLISKLIEWLWIKRIWLSIWTRLICFRLICINIKISILHLSFIVSIWRRCFILIMCSIMGIIILYILLRLHLINHKLSFLIFHLLRISFWWYTHLTSH